MEDLEVWRRVFRKCKPSLMEKLDGIECAKKLRMADVLSKAEWETLKSKETREDALIMLLDTLPTKDRFWEPLKDYLNNSNQSSIIAKLEETYTRLEQVQEEADSVETLNNPTLWRSVIQKCQSFLKDNLDAVHCATELRLHDVISYAEWETVQSCKNSAEALVKLLNIMVTKDSYWKPLLKYFRENNQAHIVECLVKVYENPRPHVPECSMPRLLSIAKLWNVPRRNPYFTGRDQLLEHLRSSLKPSQANITVISACQGLGGVGKTQLAIEFAHRYKDDYPNIFWFTAEEASLDAAYRMLAHDLKIDTQQPPDAIVREIKAWFERSPGCLLVFDNASNPEALKGYLPATGTSHILVTSRTTQWDWLGNSFTINVFTASEARAYLQELLGTLFEPSAVDTLSDMLGYLPLALAQAGAFMKKNKVPPSRYLALYEKDKKRLLASKILPPDYPEPVFITWDITMQAIRKESHLAPGLLTLCACLSSTDIPYFLLDEWAKQESNNPDQEIFEEAVGTLRGYSMLTMNQELESVSIHCLLQEVVRLKWTLEDTLHNLKSAIELTRKCSPYHHETHEDFTKTQRMLPNAEVLLDHLDKWSASIKANDMIPYIMDILSALADGYTISRSDHKRHEILKRTLSIKEKRYGPEHLEVARTLVNLGRAYGSLGQYVKQRELLQRALSIEEKHYGPDHPEVAITLVNVGNAFVNLGQHDKAQEILERALSIEEKHYGSDHAEVAITLTNLSNAYGSLGQYIKQRELLERALPIQERHYGSDHPEVAITLTNLGNAYGSLGQYNKKRELLERALSIEEKHYGPDHPEVAITLSNLGNAYGDLGQYVKAQELLERALPIQEKHYGPDHPEVAITLTSLGNAYMYLGQHMKARKLLERALPSREKHYGPDHPEVAENLVNLNCAYGSLDSGAMSLMNFFEGDLDVGLDGIDDCSACQRGGIPGRMVSGQKGGVSGNVLMAMSLYAQRRDSFVYECNDCKISNAQWHCSQCEDYDLCDDCYQRNNHEHRMENITNVLDGDNQQRLDQQDRDARIKRCIQALLHACQCSDTDCRRFSCPKMKRVIQHAKTCKRRGEGTCPVCKQLIALCCYHAKNCGEEQCLVPFCHSIRQKLHEQEQRSMNQRPNQPQNAGPGLTEQLQQTPYIDMFFSQPPQGESALGAYQDALKALPPPEGASIEKEWHKQFTPDLRNHLVSKYINSIFPSLDPADIHDQRIKDLISYARKVEKDIFELANDREEYYHCLAKKFYNFQKELQERKNARLQKQQLQQNKMEMTEMVHVDVTIGRGLDDPRQNIDSPAISSMNFHGAKLNSKLQPKQKPRSRHTPKAKPQPKTEVKSRSRPKPKVKPQPKPEENSRSRPKLNAKPQPKPKQKPRSRSKRKAKPRPSI